MKNEKMNWYLLLIILLIFVLFGFITYYETNYDIKPKNLAIETKQLNNKAQIETEWKTFKDAKGNFQFDYPNFIKIQSFKEEYDDEEDFSRIEIKDITILYIIQ